MSGDHRHHPHRSARRPTPGTNLCETRRDAHGLAVDAYTSCTYRVTLPTRRGAFLFGFHTAEGTQPTYLGTVIERYWLTLPRIMPIVRHLGHVVVPCGLHGIIRITDTVRQRSDPMMVREAAARYAASGQRVFVRHGDTVHWTPHEAIDNVHDVIAAFISETNRVFRLMQGIGEPGLWAHDVTIRRLHNEHIIRKARIELRRMRRTR